MTKESETHHQFSIIQVVALRSEFCVVGLHWIEIVRPVIDVDLSCFSFQKGNCHHHLGVILVGTFV